MFEPTNCYNYKSFWIAQLKLTLKQTLFNATFAAEICQPLMKNEVLTLFQASPHVNINTLGWFSLHRFAVIPTKAEKPCWQGKEEANLPFSEISWARLREFRTYFLHCFLKKLRNHSWVTLSSEESHMYTWKKTTSLHKCCYCTYSIWQK